jgi:hypothetical protein
MSGKYLAVGWANVVFDEILHCKEKVDGRLCWLDEPIDDDKNASDKNNYNIDETLDFIAGGSLCAIDQANADQHPTQIRIVKRILRALGTLTEETDEDNGGLYRGY